MIYNSPLSPSDGERQLLERIRAELRRLQTREVDTELDPHFEPESGVLVKISIDQSDWRLLPHDLLHLLEQLPTGADSDHIRQSIEAEVFLVWRGPSPEGSRDTTQ